MFTKSDYENLYKIMDESPEKKELLSKLLTSHQMTVSTISHEIRNPLTLVYSNLQLIEAVHPELYTYKHWRNLRSDIEYMKHLLEELSSYNNGEHLSISEINTDTFFKTIALSFASSLIETDIQFVSEINAHLSCFPGDKIKLREVFLNLLKNARDAFDSFDEPMKHPLIRLSVCSTEHHLIVSISDNGCGISEEKMSHIFEPFVTYKKNGTGLGLPLSAKIIHAHNGSIEVSSVPGFSTTLTVTLPI